MRIHIVGIAGAMTAPLAAELKRLGSTVTGSDQAKIYPPVSTILSRSKIKANKYSISPNIDLAIIGSSYKAFSNTVSEYAQIKDQKIPYISATRYIAKYVARDNSILVAGSFGKTTITSLLTWIFIQAGLDPSYLIGGEPKNAISPVHISNSKYSIIEADESINGLDTKAKFLYYPAKYVVLTSAVWEHKDSYKTADDNYRAFDNLIKKIPKTGILVCNSEAESVVSLMPSAKCRIITYGNSSSDYHITQISPGTTKTTLTIKTPDSKISLSTSLIGEHNYQNIIAGVALALELGINLQTVKKAVSTYKGVRRRLEKVNQVANIVFYDDFAQAPSRISSAIQAIHARFPTRPLKIFFEPHASFLAHRHSLVGFQSAFAPASEVILSKIPFKPDISKADRVTARDYKQEIGDKLNYLPLQADIYNHFTRTLQPNDILVHFSSGGLDGLRTFRRIINYYKKQNT